MRNLPSIHRQLGMGAVVACAAGLIAGSRATAQEQTEPPQLRAFDSVRKVRPFNWTDSSLSEAEHLYDEEVRDLLFKDDPFGGPPSSGANPFDEPSVPSQPDADPFGSAPTTQAAAKAAVAAPAKLATIYTPHRIRVAADGAGRVVYGAWLQHTFVTERDAKLRAEQYYLEKSALAKKKIFELEFEPAAKDAALRPQATLAEKLQRRVHLRINAYTLGETAGLLGQTLGAPVLIDKPALDAIGLGPDSPGPFMFQWHGTTLYWALWRYARDFDPEVRIVNLGDHLQITTSEVVSRQRVRFMRDVADWGDIDHASLRYMLNPDDSEHDVVSVKGCLTFSMNASLMTLPPAREADQILGQLRQARDWDGADLAAQSDLYLPSPARDALQAPITALPYQDAPLDAVVAHWSEQLGVAIFIDRPALEAIGLGGDTLTDSPLKRGEAHRLICKTLAGLDPELVWLEFDGAVEITTREEVSKRMIPWVYPVSDLRSGETDDEWEDTLRDLSKAILLNSTQLGYQDPISDIRPLAAANALVIRQPELLHHDTAQFLRELRATIAARPASPPAAAAAPGQ